MVLRRGFSLIEMLVVIAIAGILIVAVTMLTGRFFNISRSQFEQTRTTEDARIQIERLTDVMRNARNIVCDTNGTTDPGERWLQTADPTKIVFYSTIDSDEATEKITYEQVGNELIRTVEQDTATACAFAPGTQNVVASSIQNTAAELLLEYVTADPAVPFDIKNVVRVRLQLVIDADSRNPENASTLITEITPRLGTTIAVAGPGPGPGPGPIGWSSAIIFSSSGLFQVQHLGSLANSDSLCQAMASNAFVPRAAEFVAVLSDSTTDAKDRFSVSGPIKSRFGVLIADNDTDLWDGSVKVPILFNEHGSFNTGGSANVWTGTLPDGTKDSSPHSTFCNDWSGPPYSPGQYGVSFGKINQTNQGWIQFQVLNASSSSCSQIGHLYCIGPS